MSLDFRERSELDHHRCVNSFKAMREGENPYGVGDKKQPGDGSPRTCQHAEASSQRGSLRACLTGALHVVLLGSHPPQKYSE